MFSSNDFYKRSDWEGYIFQDYLTLNKTGIKPEDILDHNILIQRDEISCQIYVNKKGEVKNIFTSVNELKKGMPHKLNPIKSHEAETIVLKMAEKLIDIGVERALQFPNENDGFRAGCV